MNHIIKTWFLGLITVIIISMGVIGISGETYPWIVFFFICAVPAQAVIGIIWGNNLPFLKSNLSQPIKGLILVIFSILIAITIGFLVLSTVGHGIWEVTPHIIHYVILTVAFTLFILFVWNGWPFNLLTKNTTVLGILILLGAYVLTYLYWHFTFNYSITINAPWYKEVLDPKGSFSFPIPLTFAVTCVGFTLNATLFDFWPFENISKENQPVKGVLASILILTSSFLSYRLFVNILDWDPIVFMVAVPVCMIFGVFLVSNLMQFSLFTNTKQPLKGVLLIVLSTLGGILMYILYKFLAPIVVGKKLLAGSANNYELDLWIADAMLGISFPIILVLTGYFNYWPFQKQK